MSVPPPSQRATVHRSAERARYDRAALDAIIDAAYVCHVAFQDGDGSSVHCIPTVCWRHDDALLIHGSNGSRMVKTLLGGAPACVTITHLDGLVLARSAFHHSMNYRSAVIYGVFLPLAEDRKAAALDGLMNKLSAGRAAQVRPANRKELAATTVLRLRLVEFSCKQRRGGPIDDADDLGLPVWAGVLPLAMQAAPPQRDAANPSPLAEPEHVVRWRLASLGGGLPGQAGMAPIAHDRDSLPDVVLDADGHPIGRALPAWRAALAPRRLPIPGVHVRLEPLDLAKHGAALCVALVEHGRASDWTYLSVGPFADARAYLDYLAAAAASRDALHFAVISQLTGQAIGTIALMRSDTANGVVEIGHVTFSPRLQRSAGATEAVHLLMCETFDALGYRRLEWKCDALNARSRRAAARLGFRFEGLFRQAVVYKGRNRDTTWFALTDGDWPMVRARQRAWLSPTNFDAQGRQRQTMDAIVPDRADAPD